ncbi:MAG TPA: restriction endonuclease [Thermomicrobiales bacterium]|nr:restriction endonuclease [Thermomicrobiales bacterium]
MLPLLRLVGGREEMTTSAYCEALANEFRLSAEDRAALLPSGRQAVYINRATWACTYLVKAGLLERPARGRVRITARGREVLNNSPERVDIAFLGQFQQFEDFRTARPSDPPEPTNPNGATAELSPDERLLQSYHQLRTSIAEDLLERIKAAPPAFFEQLVVDLLVAMGYGGSHEDAGQAIGKSGDGGIDGIIKEDRLGLDFVYIQAKRWENVVGRPQIQGFAGSLEGQRARKGVFITTSGFTNGAREYVTFIEKRIVLIDGQQLAELMLDYGIGVTETATYKVQRIDLDYFGEE